MIELIVETTLLVWVKLGNEDKFNKTIQKILVNFLTKIFLRLMFKINFKTILEPELHMKLTLLERLKYAFSF